MLDESIQVAQLFEAAGTADFFNLNYGRMDTELALAEQNMPGMSIKLSPFLETVGAFRNEISKPVLHAAGITELATARHAISEGIVDLVGMTRAHMADPHIVNKIAFALASGRLIAAHRAGPAFKTRRWGGSKPYLTSLCRRQVQNAKLLLLAVVLRAWKLRA